MSALEAHLAAAVASVLIALGTASLGLMVLSLAVLALAAALEALRFLFAAKRPHEQGERK